MDEVLIQIEEIVEDVSLFIETSGAPGQGVPTGGTARQALIKQSSNNYDTAWVHKWEDYVSNGEYAGVTTTIASGDVLEYSIDSTTVYRFISNTNNVNGYPIEDSFYINFDGTNLTGLIVTRG